MKIKNTKAFQYRELYYYLIFKCPYQNCDKFYGSEVSLNLHMKLKHNGGNKTDREKLAV